MVTYAELGTNGAIDADHLLKHRLYFTKDNINGIVPLLHFPLLLFHLGRFYHTNLKMYANANMIVGFSLQSLSHISDYMEIVICIAVFSIYKRTNRHIHTHDTHKSLSKILCMLSRDDRPNEILEFALYLYTHFYLTF